MAGSNILTTVYVVDKLAGLRVNLQSRRILSKGCSACTANYGLGELQSIADSNDPTMSTSTPIQQVCCIHHTLAGHLHQVGWPVQYTTQEAVCLPFSKGCLLLAHKATHSQPNRQVDMLQHPTSPVSSCFMHTLHRHGGRHEVETQTPCPLNHTQGYARITLVLVLLSAALQAELDVAQLAGGGM